MKTIDNLGDLNLPERFINTMQAFLLKIATLSNANRISEVILFGSSAKHSLSGGFYRSAITGDNYSE